jgi:predicted nucleic acid-binding protein
MIVVSNTSPLNYLVLIGQINLLPTLFQQINIPEAVRQELSDRAAPEAVQAWIAAPPDWLKIFPTGQSEDASLNLLDAGEQAAILLAQALKADLLLLDDMQARRAATDRNLAITGILGLLDQAAARKLLDLPAAVNRLRHTSFWASESLLHSKAARQAFLALAIEILPNVWVISRCCFLSIHAAD